MFTLQDIFITPYENDIEAWVPERWANETLMVFEDNLILGNMVHRDFEAEVKEYGDVVNTRRPGIFKSKRKGANDDISIQDVTAQNVAVRLNQHIHTSFALRDADRQRSFADLAKEYLAPAARALASQVDECIAYQLYQAMHNAVGDLTTDITKTTLLQARNRMNNLSLPDYGRLLVVGGEQETGILGISELTNAEKVADGGQAMRTASLGQRFGMNIYKSQKMPSVSSTVAVTTGAINNGTGYGRGTKTMTVDGFTAAIATGAFVMIEGRVYQVASTVGGATPTSITLTFGLLNGVADNAVVTYIKPAAINNAAGYAADWYKQIAYDGSAAIEKGQMLSIGTGVYGALGDDLTTALVSTDVPLVSTVADDAVIGRGPNGNYGMAFVREAIALVNRPMPLPNQGDGVNAAVVNYNGLSLRIVRGYDQIKQRTIVTVDTLIGVKVLDPNAIVPVLSANIDI